MEKETEGSPLVVIFVIVLIIVAILAVIFVPSYFSDKAHAEMCLSETKTLRVPARFYQSECQLQTSGGIWIPEKYYLLICATSQCP